MSINIKPSHKGLLHRDTNTPQGQHIPEAKIQKALHSENPAVRKRSQFAENAKGFNHRHTDKSPSVTHHSHKF